MWTLVRSHLVVKIAIVLIATLGLGFAVPAVLNARLQLAEMERSGRESAQNVAQGLSAGVRTAMLSGNGITARTMVKDARDRLSTAEVRIYAPNGEEVFGVHAPVPAPEDLPSHVRAVLSDGNADPPDGDTEALPIANEQRCQGCHPDGELRGVLTLGTADAAVKLAGGDETLDVLNRVAESAFVQIMTAEKEELLDAYFEELAQDVDGIEGVSVLDPDGDHSYGPDFELATSEVKAAFEAKGSRTVEVEGGTLRVLPLANEPQCHACHDEDDTWRGAVVTKITTLSDPRGTVVGATEVSLEHVIVGDELMAVFRGPNMEARALLCAVEVVDAVHRLNAALPEGTPQMEVGIGVNVGEVVFGAMGAANRMDFTVIGDAVNLGARLCSAAAPCQVMVSKAILDATGQLPGLDCRPMEPIAVKGKREPIEVFDVRRV